MAATVQPRTERRWLQLQNIWIHIAFDQSHIQNPVFYYRAPGVQLLLWHLLMKRSTLLVGYAGSFLLFWLLAGFYFSRLDNDFIWFVYIPIVPFFLLIMFVSDIFSLLTLLIGLPMLSIVVWPLVAIPLSLRNNDNKGLAVAAHLSLLLYYGLATIAAILMIGAVNNPV